MEKIAPYLYQSLLKQWCRQHNRHENVLEYFAPLCLASLKKMHHLQIKRNKPTAALFVRLLNTHCLA